MTQLTTVDKIAMYVGGGLVLLGTLVIGLLEMILGTGHSVTGDGQIVHDALVPLEVRSYIILLGFLVWGLAGLYKATSANGAMDTRDTGEQFAD